MRSLPATFAHLLIGGYTLRSAGENLVSPGNPGSYQRRTRMCRSTEVLLHRVGYSFTDLDAVDHLAETRSSILAPDFI